MKSLFYTFALMFCLLNTGGRVQAQSSTSGTIQLSSLPDSAKTYVDGKLVVPRSASLVLPAGQHLLQVESRSGAQLQIMRQMVEVQPGAAKPVPVVLRRVILPEPGTEVWIYYPVAGAGEDGLPGPDALASRQWKGDLDVSQAAEVVQSGIDILLDDLQAQIDRLRNRVTNYERPFYVFAPTKGSRVEAGPAGPIGPVGARGRAGIPGEVSLLVTQQKQPVLDSIQHQWQMDKMRTQAAHLERRLKALAFPPVMLAARTVVIEVLTPEWKALLDNQCKVLQSALLQQRAFFETLQPSGVRGAQGERGRDGVAPAQAARQVFKEDTVADIASLLLERGGNTDRLQKVRQAMEDLERRVSLAEADCLLALPRH